MTHDPSAIFPCGRVHRRTFLADMGMGFSGLALGALLHGEGIAKGAESEKSTMRAGLPHFAPKARNVIWLFMLGGTSHVESFDPKPALTQHAGKTFAETPYNDAIINSPFYRKNVRDFAGTLR